MAKAPRKKAAPTAVPVEALTHPAANRLNIPTRETAPFAETGIGKAIYERDPALDPQLVWKRKNEADTLEVPTVPIYVQEKVHPRAIIDDLKARAAAGRPAQVDLFSDFNGLDDFQKKLEFYQHPQHWTNRLILGDSLLVMASLAEKERLRGRVQCVYFDPPYGIKFGSNWQVSTRKRDVKDAKAEDLTRQPEQIKAFRDTWESTRRFAASTARCTFARSKNPSFAACRENWITGHPQWEAWHRGSRPPRAASGPGQARLPTSRRCTPARRRGHNPGPAGPTDSGGLPPSGSGRSDPCITSRRGRSGSTGS